MERVTSSPNVNGFALAAIRGLLGLKGSDCARQLGVSQAHWSNWERGVRRASPAQVLAMANALGVDHRALLVDPFDAQMAELLEHASKAAAS